MFARRVVLGAITALVAVVPMVEAASASPHAQSGPPRKVTPKQWAAEVCPDLSFFVTTYRGIADAVSGSSSAEEAQGILIFAIDDAAIAAQDLIATIRYAGTPDVKNGKRSVALLVKEFKRVKTALDAAGSQVVGLDSDDPTQFGQDLTEIEKTTDEKIGASLNRMDSIHPKLQKALEATAECAAI
jgi:hypothetical protein